MSFSLPIAAVVLFAIYSEISEQKQERAFRNGEIFFLKNVKSQYRWMVYAANIGIAVYNYFTGFDNPIMGGLLIFSTNIVINMPKLVVDQDQVIIGNTRLKKSEFEIVELKKMDEKNAKLTFKMVIRKKNIQKDLYFPTAQMEALKEALKK